ncbi:MAG TPA: HD domain-containing protein [Draconibacterium sp.]|jgi:HD superfamily phosphohydrolase YqeK|nr:HD domain-containing protein [Draconibacterium sp.]
MKEWIDISTTWFNIYCSAFYNLTENQKSNFTIKKEHSLRVAGIGLSLAEKMEWTDEEQKIAFLVGLLHDLGRFRQLVEFDTFNDERSVDHADEAVKILKEESLFDELMISNKEVIFAAILNHNKFKIQEGLTGQEMLHAKLIRDADKLDIFRVLTEHYANRNSKANHTLTWELPKGTAVSPSVSKEIMAGKMVSKKNVASEMDVKIMQLSWVYDLNFRPSFEFLVKNRYLENVYNSLPKNDLVIEIYRKIKVFAENKIMS